MNRVAFLPQELHGAEERTRRLLPADNGAPLVVYLRKVAVGVHDVRIEIAEQRLRSRAHAHLLLQRLAAALGHPGNFGRKAFHMILLFIQQALGDEHREIAVLHAGLLESAVKLSLDVLPDGVARRTDDHAPLDAGVIHKFCLLDDVRVPLREIVFHVGDGFHKILSHCFYPP